MKGKLAGSEVVINAEKPGKGNFVVKVGDKTILSLLAMPRPFNKLREANIDEVAASCKKAVGGAPAAPAAAAAAPAAAEASKPAAKSGTKRKAPEKDEVEEKKPAAAAPKAPKAKAAAPAKTEEVEPVEDEAAEKPKVKRARKA